MLFEINIPAEYPEKPPHLIFHTKYNDVRFNPNLYTCGKVCLSILGTWNGPSWTFCMTIRTVIISISGLVLIDNPIHNEPGYEDAKPDVVNRYNAVVEYQSINVGIVKTLQNIPPKFKVFESEMINYFVERSSNTSRWDVS